jgi:hypothetical protein
LDESRTPDAGMAGGMPHAQVLSSVWLAGDAAVSRGVWRQF